MLGLIVSCLAKWECPRKNGMENRNGEGMQATGMPLRNQATDSCLLSVHSLGVGVCDLSAVHQLPGAESAGLQGCSHKTQDSRCVSKDAFGETIVC